MDITQILFWSLAILQRIAYVIIPAMAIFGIARVTAGQELSATICSPFFGLGTLSPKRGALVWMGCLILLGGMLYELYLYLHTGKSPLMPFL